MPNCTSCGHEAPAHARFCPNCGAPLEGAVASRESRKTVSVVFSDVVGSTAIAERLDPEPLRRLLLRFYEEMRLACEAHSGRVRDLLGDAVMAVFGVPVVHEDDALRAVRAALAMRERLAVLNDELEREFGLRLRSRTGVNTGEVIVREPDPTGALALGDAINVAARLQGAAGPGEILLGESTWRLVADAVQVEPVEPLLLKGKAEPVPAFRLLGVLAGAEALTRHLEAPLVGREFELARLRDAFERSVRERRCHRVTLFGAAGIGKTRLSRELAASVEAEARVLTGRCLSYGEGITYWPLREIVAQATAGRPLQALLAGVPDAGAVVARLESAIGTGTGGAIREEVFWAVRKLTEALARGRPLVLVFEDIHWAEPTLLDLIDDLTEGVHDVPLLIVCLARPELLDERPTWTNGKPNASSLLLDPLSRGQSDELITGLASPGLPASTRVRIAAAAAGNPLFLEQMLALIVESGEDANGGGEIVVPPAIQALLTARLDRLEPDPRRLLEHASVEGEIFHQGGVTALATPGSGDQIGVLIDSLVGKGLIRAERPTMLGEHAYRFRHALIRDAAYVSLTKGARSELHERHATWLEQTLGDQTSEAEEIIGYHLEQACKYRTELGPLDTTTRQLGDRARRHLAAAGRLAFHRGDTRAAINLFDRARWLPASDERARLALAPDLGYALAHDGGYEQSDAVLSDAIEQASALDADLIERHARLVRSLLRRFTNPEPLLETLTETRQTITALQGAGDDTALARGWCLLACLYCSTDAALMQEAAERAVEHLRRAGRRLSESGSLVLLGAALRDGPTPVAEAIALSDRLLHELYDDPLGQSIVRTDAAYLAAAEGRFTDARSLIADARAATQGLGKDRLISGSNELEGGAGAAILAGDLVEAERVARAVVSWAAEAADSWFFSLASLVLARIVCLRERPSEGMAILDEAACHPAQPDLEVVVNSRTVRAMALARLGRLAEAEALAREAVSLAAPTNFLRFHADALVVLADVLARSDRPTEAATTLEQAITLFQRKGHLVSTANTRTLLERLR